MNNLSPLRSDPARSPKSKSAGATRDDDTVTTREPYVNGSLTMSQEGFSRMCAVEPPLAPVESIPGKAIELAYPVLESGFAQLRAGDFAVKKTRSDSKKQMTSRSQPRPIRDWSSPQLLGILLLFSAIFAIYGISSWGNGFIYDDVQMIQSREGAHSLTDVAHLFAEPSFPNLPYYRPVTTTTLMLQRAAHGENPRPYHLFNALLIGLAGLLAYALLRLPVFKIESIPALLGAALFCLHPIASSVVYPAASGRETLLPSAWTLLAIYAYLRPGRKWYGLAIFAFAGALFSKEQAVIVPVLFLLADLLDLSGDPPGPSLRRWTVRYLPIVPIMVIYIGIRRILFEGTEFALGSLGGPFLSFAYALQDIFVPFAALYYEPTRAIWLSWPRLLIALSLLALITLLVTRMGPTNRRASWFWLGWFVVNLLPTANLLQQEAPFDDRYVFLASLSVFALAASITSTFWDTEMPRRLILVSGLVLVACSAALTHHRSGYFQDDISFSRQWIGINPDSVNAHFSMGLALARKRRFDEAIRHYAEALRIRPEYALAHNNLGDALLKSGRIDESLPHFSKALELNADYAEAHYNMATALVQLNQPEKAIRHFSEVVRLQPRFTEAHNNLGNTLARQKRWDEAIEHYAKALEAHPENADAHNNWANALVEQGKLQEAIEHYSAALEIRPGFPEARRNLSAVLDYMKQ